MATIFTTRFAVVLFVSSLICQAYMVLERSKRNAGELDINKFIKETTGAAKQVKIL